ncbi:MAG TPA: hypothetical protein VF306_02250 [Pirellulales bacterium]
MYSTTRYQPFAMLLAVFAVCGLSTARLDAAEARVEIELATQRNYIATSQQQWYRLFTELGVDNLRIRKALDGEKAETTKGGTKNSPVYRVTGLLQAGDVLVLPEGKFGLRDRARLAQWLADLRSGGARQANAEQPFGLDATQYADILSDMSRRVGFSTKDLKPAELLSKLSPTLGHRLLVDRFAKAQLAAAGPLGEELQDFSRGTALAYTLRSAGLGFVPQPDARKQVQYAVVSTAARQAVWPVGWPLGKKKPDKVLPGLFESIPVDIDDYPLDEALSAIGDKVGFRILYDHAALARRGIETNVTVSFPPGKSWYFKIIDKLLHQADLQGEWRLDDADKPLLWVTTLKPVRN